MAFGLAGASGSFQANMAIVGGIVTGSSGEFLALPISSTVLGGLSGLNTNEWSRFYLSDSFGAASASVIQALNYLSASMDATSGDVTGPASSNDHAVVRFNGDTGKLIQNTSQVLIGDNGAISSSVTAHFVDGITGKLVAVSSSVSGAGNVAGQSLNLGAANNFKVGILGALSSSTTAHFVDGITGKLVAVSSSVVAGTTVSGAGAVSGQNLVTEEATITAAGVISGAGAVQGQKLTIANSDVVTAVGAVAAVTTVSGAGAVAGQSLAFGANGSEFAVSNAGAIAGGNNGDSYALTAAGVISSSNAITAGTTIAAVSTITAGTQLNAGTNVSGVGSFLGAQISVGNGAGTISQAGAFVGQSFQGQSVQASAIKSSEGSISASVASSVQFSNTASAGGNNYKAAMLISSSDIQGAGNAALIPRMVMQGTDDAGNLTDFMISVSGGLLQVVELTYGNALPI